jgi:ABC-type uncharacterized transport system permease subunit
VRLRLLVAFVVGVAFFAVLPAFALLVVLQWEDVLPFLIGSGAGVAAGTALRLVGGSAWGMQLALSCALVGVLLHVVAYPTPAYGSGATWSEQVALVGIISVHMGVLATLAGPVLGLLARLRRGRGGF